MNDFPPRCKECGWIVPNHQAGCSQYIITSVEPVGVTTRKLKLRIVTTVGWFDMDPPDKFDMHQMVRAIKADGYVCNPMLFVPYDHIVTVYQYWADKPPSDPRGPNVSGGVVIEFPGGKAS